MNKKSLSEYVRLAMKQKRLSALDVERRCNKKITNSYIGRIARGEITNLTVFAIDALAEGLGVDPYELFAIAYGKPSRSSKTISAADPLALIEAMQRLVMNPQLIEVLLVWEELPPEHQATLLASLRSFREQRRNSKRGGKLSARRK